MAEIHDGYVSYYANRIWQRLPAIYRASDRDDPSIPGPLEELVHRIAAQVAVVRRSIDRLWADQSIETSDDWAIPYIGALLDTNLVGGLAPAAQRLDVAKTIHYRRRKGTLAILEEIARDVTGWDAHVVEGFRRLSRTRHGLDPAVGAGPFAAALPSPCAGTPIEPGPDVDDLLRHEALVGALTGTPAGGFADLRSVHGGMLAGSPFDEYFHTADVRLGQGAVGHFGIAKLLVFLWRLQSFTVPGGTPVAVLGCPGEYVFDPTGRQIELFLPPPPPEPDDFADIWTSATEWQVPGPLTESLQDAILDPGTGPPAHAQYPASALESSASTPSLYAAIGSPPQLAPAFYDVTAGSPLEPVSIEVRPEVGQFAMTQSAPGDLTVSYQYGFPATIGAGPYDRSVSADPPDTIGDEATVAGGARLDLTLASVGDAATVTIGDSLTYEAVSDVGSTVGPIGSLLVRAGDQVRPVIRLPAPSPPGAEPFAWVFTGGADSQLTLDGLFMSGGDIVLRGAFNSVRLTSCTTDPGTLTGGGETFAESVDGRSLTPCRIWIEADPNAPAGTPGAISALQIDHCVLGPIRTRGGGGVEQVTIADSIVQGIVPAAGDPPVLQAVDIFDPQQLARSLASADPLSHRLMSATGGSQPGLQQLLAEYRQGEPGAALQEAILSWLNGLITGAVQLDALVSFDDVPLDPELAAALADPFAADVAAVNRALLEAAYPISLAPAALALAQGTVSLSSVTIMGRSYVHRLNASDSLLAEFAAVDDTQTGCIRFSAVLTQSHVPSGFQSAQIAPGAALFTADAFGQPGYGQLLETADQSIVSTTATGVTISAGADNQSEMGAFCGQLGPIKERGLLSKYAEYMPLGLTPVVVHVT